MPPFFPLVLAALLIAIGIFGLLSRRNLVTIVFATEILFSGINLTFATFAQVTGSIDGVLFVFFVMAVSACEVVVLLALTLLLYRTTGTIDIEALTRE